MLIRKTIAPASRKAWCPRRKAETEMTIVMGSAILNLDTFVSITRRATGHKMYNKEVKK
jgi:hypothetical protein